MSLRCPERAAVLAAACTLSLIAACDRGAPGPQAAMGGEQALVRTSELQAGPPANVTTRNPLAGNQTAQSDGERLFTAMNCAGCHGSKGGGSIGPPFLDADWIYGRDPAVLFQSVSQGRPNGMPAYGGKLPAGEIWRIVLYVESLAAQGDGARASARGSTSGPSGSGAR